LEIGLRETDRVTVIVLNGIIKTGEDYDAFKKAIDDVINEGCMNVVLNFKSVNFINSSGLGRLIIAAKRINEDNGALKIAGLSDDLRELFAFTRLDSKLQIFETEQEAIQSF
jgi:anti-anti-sigma factor